MKKKAYDTIKFPVSCDKCGALFNRDEWKALRFVGIQSGYLPEEKIRFFPDLDLRDCVCGTTNAVPVRLLNDDQESQS